MGEMYEKDNLINLDQQQRLRRVEEELLYDDHFQKRAFEPPTTFWGMTDSTAFLLGYQLLSIVANAYMSMNTDPGASVWFYAAGIAFNALGIYGLSMLKTGPMIFYAVFLVLSFIFSSTISVFALSYLVRIDVCSNVASIIPGMAQSCNANPMLFKIVGSISVFAELFLEIFIIVQTKRVCQYVRNLEKEKKSIGSYGSISLN